MELIEIYDPAYATIGPGVWLQGYFQSPRYLEGYEDAVKDWFMPNMAVRAEVERLKGTFPAIPEEMVAVHVRRTDYLLQRDPFSHPETGWALPRDYYREALNRLPKGLRLAFFSDDPQFVIDQFRGP